MSEEVQFREAERLFHTALALSPERRAGFVERRCAGDESMRTWLLSLLSHAGSPTVGFTPPPPAPLDGGDDGERMAWFDAAGTCIGRYTLVRQLGEGGFGAVYLAEQAEPILRTVALKIIKPGMDSKQVLARFERERQALALMNHPGIARVLDAGVTDPPGCRPYFVMELVTGTPITAYCDQHGLSLNQRLELFGDLCRAVQHAHQKGVVHRDLKPSNILVTVVDRRAVPKVIDFGIAKALRSEAVAPGERTIFTEQGQLIGTPEYMSPEQADGFVGSDDIDTRSDIYSLGVILYELLTGVLPFDREQLHAANLAQTQRIIRDVDPPKPSTRLSNASKRSSVRASREPFIRALRSDLDWVVMRCLEKERSRRYETADALAQDINRFLSNEPVSAGPPSATYRMRKFVRRNRAAVTAGSLVAAILVLAVIGTTTGLAWALREHDRATHEALRATAAEADAEERLAELEQVADFQASMLADFDLELMGALLRHDLLAEIELLIDRLGLPPEEAVRRRDTIEWAFARLNFTTPAVKGLDRQVIQRARETVDRDFADQPLVQARLLHTLGQALTSLGRGGEARELHERALQIRQRILGNDHPDTITSLAARGGSPLSEAETVFLDVLERRRRILGDDHPDTLASLSRVGRVIQSQGRLAEAEPYLRESLERRRRVFGDDHPATMDAVAELGVLLHLGNHLFEAEALYHDVLQGRRRLFGEDHPSTMKSKGNIAWLLHSLGRMEEAERYLREGVEYNRRVLGDTHPHTLYSMSYLGDLLLEMGHLDEAETWFRQSLDGHLRKDGPAHGTVLNAHFGMGALRTRQGRFNEAEYHLRVALEGWGAEEVRATNSSPYFKALMSMGAMFEAMGRLDEAEECFREAVEGRRTFSREHWHHTLESIHALARVVAALGRLDEAEALYREALDGRIEILGEDHLDTAGTMHALAAVVLKGNTNEALVEAESLLRECLAIRQRVLNEDDWRIPDTQSALGGAIVAQAKMVVGSNPAAAIAKFAKAESLLIDGYERMNLPPAGAARKAEALRRIIDLYDAWHAAEPNAGHDANAEHWRAIDVARHDVRRRPIRQWMNPALLARHQC